MAGLKISPSPAQGSAGNLRTSDPKARHLHATNQAIANARAVLADIYPVLHCWQYVFARSAVLREKIVRGKAEGGEVPFLHLEISGLLDDIDEQVQGLGNGDTPLLGSSAKPLSFALGEGANLDLEMMDDLALSVADFGVSASSLLEIAPQQTPAQETPAQETPAQETPAQETKALRVVADNEQPNPPQTATPLEKAAAHLDSQQRLFGAAKQRIDRVSSQASVFAENLIAARSHLNGNSTHLAHATATAMRAAATRSTAAIGAAALTGVDDRIFRQQ